MWTSGENYTSYRDVKKPHYSWRSGCVWVFSPKRSALLLSLFFLTAQSLSGKQPKKVWLSCKNLDYSRSWGTGRGLLFETSHNNSKISFLLRIDHWPKFPVAQRFPSGLMWAVSLCIAPTRGMMMMRKSLNMIFTPCRCWDWAGVAAENELSLRVHWVQLWVCISKYPWPS